MKNKEREELLARVESLKKELYDARSLLELSKGLCSVKSLPLLLESILFAYMCQLQVSSAGLFLPENFDSSNFVLDVKQSGFTHIPHDKLYIHANHPIMGILKAEKKSRVFSFCEIQEQLPAGSDIDFLLPAAPSLLIPLLFRGLMLGIIVLGERIDPCTSPVYLDSEKEGALVLASFASIALYNMFLIEASSVDMMTHLRLRHYFFSACTDVFAAAKLKQMPVSIIMLDIDFFKKVNDMYGHACGDYVLQITAELIRRNVRENDVVARYGGEEFTVLLPDTDDKAARNIAERIRCAIEINDFCFNGMHLTITISCGVAVWSSYQEDPKPALLIDMADRALYYAKNNGRNRTSVFDANVQSKSAAG